MRLQVSTKIFSWSVSSSYRVSSKNEIVFDHVIGGCNCKAMAIVCCDDILYYAIGICAALYFDLELQLAPDFITWLTFCGDDNRAPEKRNNRVSFFFVHLIYKNQFVF